MQENNLFRQTRNLDFMKRVLVKDVMSKDLVCLNPDEDIEVAVNMFLENETHSILILQADVLVGILTPYDILKHYKTMINAEVH